MVPDRDLSALRELALLWLAATLAGARRWHPPDGHTPGSSRARERVVVALGGGSDGDVLIRRAARIAAQRGGGPTCRACYPAWRTSRPGPYSPPSDS